MKKLLLWLAMVILLVALLLGGAIGALYVMTDESALPQEQPTLGELALESIGYDWQVPILGGVVNKPYTQPPTLTVQKLGAFSEATPALALPAWASRNGAVLTAPDGTVVLQGDAAAFNSYAYTQNGAYELELTLYQDGAAAPPAKADGWYQYRVGYTVNLQPKAALATARTAQGGVAVLTVTGILDGGTPALETDLGTVWFRATADGFVGYIPVTYNAEGGDHVMTLTCGALTQELTLTVTQSSYPTVTVPAEEESPAGAGTEYQNAIWPLYTQGSAEKLWTGAFTAPSASGVSIAYGSVLMTNGARSGRATGLYYAAPAGETVKAPQAGTVAYAGTLALTGGTVVVDHGCGVKSYLFGLDAVSVQRGQTVALGDAVGTASAEHRLIYELRIGSKSVDPADAIDGSGGLQSKEGTA